MPTSVFTLLRGLHRVILEYLGLNSVLICGLILGWLGGCTPHSKDSHQVLDSSSTVAPPVLLEERHDKVIYGEDTRQDVYELEDPDLERLARRSIMAMFSADSVRVGDDGQVSLQSTTLGQRYQLCNDQRYISQPAAASCSSTLIDDDLIVTAGHCVGTQAECQSKRFILGYQMDSAEDLAPITSESVFSCSPLVLSVDTNGLDYAFIRLDRPVNPMLAEPAPIIQNSEPLDQNEPLVMMGFLV